MIPEGSKLVLIPVALPPILKVIGTIGAFWQTDWSKDPESDKKVIVASGLTLILNVLSPTGPQNVPTGVIVYVCKEGTVTVGVPEIIKIPVVGFIVYTIPDGKAGEIVTLEIPVYTLMIIGSIGEFWQVAWT